MTAKETTRLCGCIVIQYLLTLGSDSNVSSVFLTQLADYTKHKSKEAASTGILKHWLATNVSLWLAKCRTRGRSHPVRNMWENYSAGSWRVSADHGQHKETHTEHNPRGKGDLPKKHYVSIWYATKINIASVALGNNDTQDVFLLDVPLFNLSLWYSCEIGWLRLNVLFLLVCHSKKKNKD